MIAALLIFALFWLWLPSSSFPVPARHPRTAHFMPYLFGDSLAALKRAKRLRFKYVDQNGLCDAEGQTWISHWPKYRKQYRWYFTGRTTGSGNRRREIRARVPAHWPEKFHNLTTAQAASLRSARIGGRRPLRARTHMHEAHRLGLVLCLEVKNSPGFLKASTWHRLAGDRDATGCRVIVMTLQNQGGNAHAFVRLTGAHAAGFPVALLPRGKRPSNWHAAWVPMGVRQWGRWR